MDPGDHNDRGVQDESNEASDRGEDQGNQGHVDTTQDAARDDELRHQDGDQQELIQAEGGGRAIVGRVLQAPRPMTESIMGADPGIRHDQAVLEQAPQQGSEDGVEFESADDAEFESTSPHGDEGGVGTHAADVSNAAVLGDLEQDEMPPSAEAIDTAPAIDENSVETDALANFDAAIAAGDMRSARSIFLS